MHTPLWIVYSSNSPKRLRPISVASFLWECNIWQELLLVVSFLFKPDPPPPRFCQSMFNSQCSVVLKAPPPYLARFGASRIHSHASSVDPWLLRPPITMFRRPLSKTLLTSDNLFLCKPSNRMNLFNTLTHFLLALTEPCYWNINVPSTVLGTSYRLFHQLHAG